MLDGVLGAVVALVAAQEEVEGEVTVTVDVEPKVQSRSNSRSIRLCSSGSSCTGVLARGSCSIVHRFVAACSMPSATLQAHQLLLPRYLLKSNGNWQTSLDTQAL